MATRTESLIGKLSINDSEWRAGLAKAAAQFRSFAMSTGRMLGQGLSAGFNFLKNVGGVLAGVAGQVAGFLSELGGIGAVLSAGGIVAGIKNVADLGGELSDMNARTGIAIDQLVLLREQFRQGGIDAASVTEVVIKMNKALLDSKKAGQFAALGLDQAMLLSQDPTAAINSIISAVRKLGTLAEKQRALSSIFGKATGPQMMTLVADTQSLENARKMVGELPYVMQKAAGDFDTISDNLFGGIPVKIQQAFAGFADALRGPLLKATEMVTSMDFTQVGEKLGKQLLWSFEFFKNLWQQGNLGEYIFLQMESGFIRGVSFLVNVMGKAWAAIFNPRNLMAIDILFTALTYKLGAAVNDIIGDFYQSIGRFGKADTQRAEAETKRKAASSMNMSVVAAIPQFAEASIKEFGESLGDAGTPLPVFAKNLQDINARIAKLSFGAHSYRMGDKPVEGWADLNPMAQGKRREWTDKEGNIITSTTPLLGLEREKTQQAARARMESGKYEATIAKDDMERFIGAMEKLDQRLANAWD